MDFDNLLSELNDKTLNVAKLRRREQLDYIEAMKGSDRLKNIDLIAADSGAGVSACCISTKCGIAYGCNSSYSPCGNALPKERSHKIVFIDNDFKKYNHQKHLAYIKKLYEEGHRPKYVTVRDLMTKDQCLEAGIDYYSFEQILDFAAELEEYTENVIVIPKYDCIDSIPEKYVLGFSVPSKYGGTDLPLEMFKGRRVHLLGGSPNKQIAILSELQNEVISIDGNYLRKMALSEGKIWLQDGTIAFVKDLEIAGKKIITDNINIFYPAISISLSNWAQYYHRRDLEAVNEL